MVELGGISYWESSKLLPCHTTRDRHDDDDKEYLSQKRERFKIRLHVCFELFGEQPLLCMITIFYECSTIEETIWPRKVRTKSIASIVHKTVSFFAIISAVRFFACQPNHNRSQFPLMLSFVKLQSSMHIVGK